MSFHGFFPDSSPPGSRHGSPATVSGHRSRHQLSEHGTPTRQQLPATNGHIRSPLTTELNSLTLSLPPPSLPTTPSTESPDQWSSAVGRATVGGKSGRVIERLMGENDRLQREIKLATVKLEEEARRSESARAALDLLRSTNENLVAICETNSATLIRKDRKIEELKADLEAERVRREMAEARAKAIGREGDEAINTYKKDSIEEKEIARKASTQYEILASSWRGLDDGYRRHTENLRADIEKLQDDRQKDLLRFIQLEVIIDQLSLESEKVKKQKEKVLEEFEEYKKEKEDGIKQMRAQAERNELANNEALKEMDKVLGEMKYVINVKKNVQDVG